ncbi:hypothetical protein ACHAW5_005925 [Stephanodiscus triporus]|uniref:protein-serine/threonine phosphatase n=1 Tax=Stephanodiscus triporus TaxID=2934178 RepID=A0ABD3QX52_9STRA
MISSSSPNEAIPELPIPPAAPSLPTDAVAARALKSLSDEAMPSSLDVHIRWAVESGNIVHKGEKIAQLFYTFHGMPPPPPSSTSSAANNGNAIIRARRINQAMQFPETSNTIRVNSDASPKEVICLEIRSPSNGFLRVLFKKASASNAVHINQTGHHPELSVINLILAAIEPCEHPAVVGGMCVVCGADMRGPPDGKVQMENPIHLKKKDDPALRTKHVQSQQQKQGTVGTKEQQIIDKQRKLAASIAPSSELVIDVDDEEIANLDMDAAISFPPNASNNTANRAPQPIGTKTKPKLQPTVTRSLSSLLSGARATHKLQETPKQKQPPNRHPRPTAINLSSHVIDDSQMTKMTVSGGVTIAISKSEAKNISEVSSRKLREERKLCLVLDLDHTLLHATDDYRAGRFVADMVFAGDKDSDEKEDEDDKTSQVCKPKTKPNPEKREDVRSILLPVELPPLQQQLYVQQKLQQQKLEKTKFCLSPLPQQMQGTNPCIIMRHFIKLRPHLKEFFSQIQSTYQLSVYTAGTRSYAEQVALMICRHLVGATLDEEGLNELRMKVRDKDEECRRFKARVGRISQLKLAKMSEPALKVDSNKSSSKKSVSFGGSADNNAHNEIDVDVEDSKFASSSFSNKRTHPKSSEVDTTHIPKKKKDLHFSVRNSNETEYDKGNSEDVDPAQERDRLRKELEGAEKLEVEAIGLRRKIFGSRIVSRTDVGDLGMGVKSLNRVFPCGGAMAAILDDREDVWANAEGNVTGRPGEPPDNLLLAKPYHWEPFSGYADVNNASGQDLSSTSDGAQHLAGGKLDETEDDSQLLWTADILRRLHERYYSTSLLNEERDRATVPSLLQTMRKETLMRFPRAKIVFSGLIPINKQNKQTHIRPHVVRYAEELGAEVLPGISNEVTHVVAARDRSEKISQARKQVPGCFIVHTSWLMECYWSITRRDVEPHHMGPLPSRLAKQRSGEESDEDDSEDDFAEDLAKEMTMSGK